MAVEILWVNFLQLNRRNIELTCKACILELRIRLVGDRPILVLMIDPDDPIFPRAATRVGAKFQATVLSWEEQQEAELHHGFGDSEAGPSRHIGGTFGSHQ